MSNPNPQNQFKTGNPGRLKGSLNKSTLFLSVIFADKDFDWASDFAEAIKTGDEKKIDRYMKVLPFLCVHPSVNPLQVQVDPNKQTVSTPADINKLKEFQDTNTPG